MSETYKIVRFYFGGGNRVIKTGLTLEEAQEHCQRPDTSSSTGGVDLTTNKPWFDGYESEEERSYQGWTNHATWEVNLYLSNTESMYRRMLELIEESIEEPRAPGDTYVRPHDQSYAEAIERFARTVGFNSIDLDTVDWIEIARSWLENAE